jgi:hypothetical protein
VVIFLVTHNLAFALSYYLLVSLKDLIYSTGFAEKLVLEENEPASKMMVTLIHNHKDNIITI